MIQRLQCCVAWLLLFYYALFIQLNTKNHHYSFSRSHIKDCINNFRGSRADLLNNGTVLTLVPSSFQRAGISQSAEVERVKKKEEKKPGENKKQDRSQLRTVFSNPSERSSCQQNGDTYSISKGREKPSYRARNPSIEKKIPFFF